VSDDGLPPSGSILGQLHSMPGNRQGHERGMWPAIYPEILADVRAHRSTIVFVNNRALAERLAERINELAGEELVLAHHGSVSHEKRAAIEERLKRGAVRGIVATSSLELGIDMGAVDLVVLVE
jgi:ATP-dependent Lhr-like helicase